MANLFVPFEKSCVPCVNSSAPSDNFPKLSLIIFKLSGTSFKLSDKLVTTSLEISDLRSFSTPVTTFDMICEAK